LATLGAHPAFPFADVSRRVDSGGTPSVSFDHDPAPMRQAALLREMAARLEGGETALPTDVLAPLARELELRLDDAAIDEAYQEQGERKGEPWVFFRGRAQG